MNAVATQEQTTFAPWPFFEPDEIEAANTVLSSGKVNYWTGTEGRRFEEEFADFAGVRHAIALANGTVALEAAFEALGIGPGGEVILTPRTFLASASAIVRVGATPVFADIDHRSGNFDINCVEAAITSRTRAILAVHLGGWPCDMSRLMDLASAKGIHVVEDCAQAHGASYAGRSVGSFGIISAWSFCQDKIITTAGEGGMVTTDDEALWNSMWSLKDHGKSFDAVYRREHKPGFRWLHESFGTNWRLPEVQSAIGRIQLRKLPEWHRLRTEHAEALLNAWEDLSGLRCERPGPDEHHAYYKFYAYVRPEALTDGWTRDRIMEEIVAAGVPCFTGSCSEIYLEKAFATRSLNQPERLPVAKELGETSLMFLVHPTLDERAMSRTADVVRSVMLKATR
ncbi:MAG: DegT/DnrJ/EryC1/StrS aminotransferase family protein [Verrucomicrobiaceae bacterium]|nr:MAG: DegT/DnrJ/EryC1/StrS aminotransferase family protein [Verrucomicrobiaceae bacterium]